MLDIVCFKWKPAPGYRSKFGPEAVNVLARMVRRHYQKPHRFTCVTDDPAGIDCSIRIIPLWPDHGELLSLHGKHNPSCFRRLKLFSPEAAQIIGPRFVSLDLDIVITGDLVSMWDRPDDFVIWKNATPPTPYNGSMLLMTAGARSKVWTDFDPKRSPQEAKAGGSFGSDQAWISHKLGNGEKTWDQADGVYSYRAHIAPKIGPMVPLPENAKIVIFHGRLDPWDAEAQRIGWIREHWR